MDFWYEVGGQTVRVQIEPDGDDYQATVGERRYAVQARLIADGAVALAFEGNRRSLAYVALDGDTRWVALAAGQGRGRSWVLTVPNAGRPARRGAAAGPAALEAQMPGLVRQVLVEAGQPVTRGQPLVVLEAMKMEIRVTAPHDGVATRITVKAGQAVERGQTLVELAPVSRPPA